MCNNAKRNVLVMQFMIMTIPMYTHLTMVINGRFDAMWEGGIIIIFFIQEDSFIAQNIKVSEN